LSERKIRLEDAMPLIRERLGAGHEVTFSPRGSSMLPFLKEGRDTVTLKAPPKKLKKYDIPLYQRKNGQYVLHRVVHVGDTYTCIGDNQFVLEKGIEQEQVIAVCTSFVRKGKKIYASAPLWRLYAVFWHYSRFPRRVLCAIWHRVKRLGKK
jgi:hypothetical protein